MRMFLGLTFTLALALALRADWVQFRGPNATGVSDEKNLPVEWGKGRGIKWKAALPARGVSSPIIFDSRVYVTCSSGVRDDRLHVLCFEAKTGKELWHRQLLATGPTACHPKTCMAGPTPVADDTGVYALFATGDLAAFDHDGTLRWYRSLVGDYPTVTNQVGMAASPVLAKDRLIVPMDNEGESFLAAVDIKYGKNLWKVQRPQAINWVTPLIREVKGRTEILFAGPSGLAAYDFDNGDKRWEYKEGGGSIPTGVLQGELLYLPRGGVTAVKLDARGVAGKPAVVAKDLSGGYSSPLVYRGKLYSTDSNGFISCAEAKTGKLLFKERTRGAYSASPIAGDGKIYCLNEAGVTTVLKADSPDFDLLATNDLGEETLATPAIAGDCLFIRTNKSLYCLGK